MEQFEDKVLQILTAASAVSLVIGIIKEGWATVYISYKTRESNGSKFRVG